MCQCIFVQTKNTRKILNVFFTDFDIILKTNACSVSNTYGSWHCAMVKVNVSVFFFSNLSSLILEIYILFA